MFLDPIADKGVGHNKGHFLPVDIDGTQRNGFEPSFYYLAAGLFFGYFKKFFPYDMGLDMPHNATVYKNYFARRP